MPISAKNDADFYTGLSSREVELLAGWERERRSIVTLPDIRDRVGAAAAARVASNLVRKRMLQRVRRGTYLVRPLRAMGRPTTTSTVVAVEALLQREPHYLGGLWALSLHHLTDQRYDALIDAFVVRRLAARRLGAARVRFHVLPKAAFAYGLADTVIEGVTIRISDAERTVLDALDRPRIFLGVTRGLELLTGQLAKLDQRKLIAYAVAGSAPTTCQRLGALLQRHGTPRNKLAGLRRRALETRSLLSMNPDAPRRGPINRDWNVVENDR